MIVPEIYRDIDGTGIADSDGDVSRSDNELAVRTAIRNVLIHQPKTRVYKQIKSLLSNCAIYCKNNCNTKID